MTDAATKQLNSIDIMPPRRYARSLQLALVIRAAGRWHL